MKHSVPILLCLALAAFLAGCASRNLVVLLPDQDGSVGAIEVANARGSVTIAEPGETASVASADRAPKAAKPMSEEKISRTFREALAAEPRRPEIFLLYYQRDSTRLTDQSTALIPQILEAIRERESLDISVIGHTDRIGDRKYNFILSRERARHVRDLLVEKGVDAELISVTSHGEDNPLIPTPDEVAEPKNRRVEVVVR
ncbi:MAG TPA: OmpA family protein [Desulfobacteraceae bacterium]|nr:OmpA family protein [Desulfobacteraceae bacterium]